MSISVHPYINSQANKRSVKYVAPTTASVTFQVIAVNGQAVTGQPVIEQDLVASAAGCTTSNGTVTCSTTVPVIVGTVTFQVKTYNQTGAAGTQLGTALASASIVANQANRIALTVSGIIAQVQIFLSPASQTPGTAGKSLVVVVPQDANGNIIVNPGNYDQPIQLSLAGGTVGTSTVPHVGFEEDGATTPSTTATVASPNDQVYVAYDGTAGAGNAVITANVAEAPPVTATASLNIGSNALTSSLSSTYLQNTGFAFTGGNQTGTISLSGGTPPYIVSFSPPAGSNGTSVARAAAASRHVLLNGTLYDANVTGSTVTVTTNADAYGSATLYVYDSASTPNQFTIPVSVTAPPITIYVPNCPTGSTCGTGQITLPATSTATVTLDYSGGGADGFTNTFASTGGPTSQCGTGTSTATTLTFTSNGSCSDLLVVTSDNQSAYYAFVQPSGTAAYTIASTSHAYSPSANTVAIADGGQASIALTASNGPWSYTQSGCTPDLTITNAFTGALANTGYVLALSTNPATETNCSITFTPTTGTSVTLTVMMYPKLTVSAQSFAFHAPGDTGSVTVANGSPTGLTVASGSIEIASESTEGVLMPTLTYTGGVVGFAAGSLTGTALISIHDTNFDEKYGVSVSVDNADQQSLPQAIALNDGVGTNAPVVDSIPAPSWVVGTSNFALGSAVVNAGSTISITPSVTGSGTITFTDAIGGSVTVPVTSFALTFPNYLGSNIGAANPEAFPGVGLSETVGLQGPGAGVAVSSSNPSVVAISNVQTSGFTATSVAAGVATITITDQFTSASISYQASVTSVTIPILGHRRSSR